MLLPYSLPVVPAMRRIIDEYNSVRAKILQTVTPDTARFENVMDPLAQVENSVQGTFVMIDMLQYGSPSLATQGAFDEAQGTWLSDESFFNREPFPDR